MKYQNQARVQVRLQVRLQLQMQAQPRDYLRLWYLRWNFLAFSKLGLGQLAGIRG